MSSLDEAGCDQTEVASVCGDEQRSEPTNNDAVAIDGQQTSASTRRTASGLAATLMLVAAGQHL